MVCLNEILFKVDIVTDPLQPCFIFFLRLKIKTSQFVPLQMVHMALTALSSVTNSCFKEKKIRFQCFMWWENTALQCCMH